MDDAIELTHKDLAALFPESSHSLSTRTDTILIYPPKEKQTQVYCEVICEYAETFGLSAETITDASVPYVHAEPDEPTKPIDPMPA